MKNSTYRLYRDALGLWGKGFQIMVLFEEFGELMQIISKVERKHSSPSQMAGEIADCIIMLEQLQVAYDLVEETTQQKKEKLNRLRGMIQQHKAIKIQSGGKDN